MTKTLSILLLSVSFLLASCTTTSSNIDADNKQSGIPYLGVLCKNISRVPDDLLVKFFKLVAYRQYEESSNMTEIQQENFTLELADVVLKISQYNIKNSLEIKVDEDLAIEDFYLLKKDQLFVSENEVLERNVPKILTLPSNRAANLLRFLMKMNCIGKRSEAN